MSRPLFALLPLLCSSIACVAPHRAAIESRSAWFSAPLASTTIAMPRATVEPFCADAGGAPNGIGALELSIWNDPAFRRQFTESYAAETEIEPKLSVTEREPMQKILELMSADQLEPAADLVQKQRSGASSAVFDFTYANIRFQQDRFQDAARAYETAVEKFPKFRRAWRNLALIHVRLGDHANAARAFVRVVELGGGDAATYGLLAFSYSNLDDHLAAESGYRMAAMLDPQTMDWKLGLARSFFKQKRYTDAAALCDGLIQANRDRADLWLLQANAFIGMGQPRKAAENYEIVDRMGHSTGDTLNNLADIYVNEELFDMAVSTFDRAMAKDAAARPVRALRAAKVLSSRGATAETRRLVDSIESKHGTTLDEADKKDLLKLRARIAVAEGAGEEEARVLEEIVSLDPLDGEALVLLGQHYGRTGDVERAIFYFERASSIEAFEADAKVRQAQLLVSKGRYGEALPLLRRAQTVQPRENVQQYLDQVERVAQSRQ
jgi:tetratricopeptide (TPR) repeat protein